MLILYILIFIISCGLLVFSGKTTVKSLTKIAHFLQWKEFIVAFILMAFATSIPELFVCITAALNKISELSLGVILGSNIINLTLPIGIAVLILGGLEVERETVRRNSIFVGIIALLPLLLLLDGGLSRIDGCILLLAFGFYISWLFDRKELFTKIYEQNGENQKNKGRKALKRFLKDLGIFLGSVILLLIAAQGIVKSASAMANLAGISLGVVGILIVGAGTSLPEIYFSIQAGKNKKSPMILGNIMGSVVINSTLILGIVSIISPIKIINFSPYFLCQIFLLISVFISFLAIRTGNKISKKEAILLILIYILFFILEIKHI